MNEYLTIKEVAEASGLSKQAIYKRLSTDLQPFFKLIENKKMLNYNVLKVLNSTYNSTDFKQVENKDNQVESNKTIEILNKTINLLTEQLSTKDKQIDNLTNTVNQLNLRIAELTELQRNNQILMLQEKKPGFFDRIFRKKLDT